MKYAYINNDRIVHEIIPAFADEFPGYSGYRTVF